MSQQDVHVEHHCEVCFRMAARRCVPCDILCCEIHMKPHQHKGHKVVNPEVKLEELICANHGKPIQLYCNDDKTMMCLMCQMCKDGKHKNHNVVTLETVHAELKDVLKTKCPEVSKSKQHLQSQLDQLQEEVEQTQHTGQSTEGRLEERRRELYQLVDETVDLLMSRVIKRKNKKLSLLMKNMEKRQQQLKSVLEAESLLQTALQELEAVYFMQGFKDLVQRLESVSHFQYLKMAPRTSVGLL
uniref:B box-type domain-containing protein n=1 Tax=Eptatretus burgeri TaxID=7764 RepID=A0A8C4R1J7_EPTBU